MLAVVDRIGEDELFQAWMEHLAEINGCRDVDDLYELIYHRRRKDALPVSYAVGLEQLTRAVQPSSLFPDVRKIIRYHTCFYAEMPFKDLRTQVRDVEQMARGMSLLTGRALTRDHARYRMCPVCRREDRAHYGREIVHAPHQMDDVVCCWKHGAWLTSGEDAGETGMADDLSLAAARMAHDLYVSPIPVDRSANAKVLQEALDRHGMTYDEAKARITAAWEEEFPGPEILSHVRTPRASLDGGASGLWIAAMLFRNRDEYASRFACGSEDTIIEEDCSACGRTHLRHRLGPSIGVRGPYCADPLKRLREVKEAFGFGDEYALTCIDGQAVMKHIPCGKVYGNAVRTIWANNKCECERNITRTKLQERFGEDLEVIAYDRKTLDAEVRHRACGRTFTRGYRKILHSKLTGSGCPYCDNSILIPGFNDLETLAPDIAAGWDREKNGGLAPGDVTSGSTKQVHWKCEKGHSWQAPVYTRMRSGCPYCAGKKVLKGFNDLETTDPALAAEWDTGKNGAGPDSVTCGSRKTAWWRCGYGHSWQAKVSIRHAKKSGCPECDRLRHLANGNDLLSACPEIADLWDKEANGPLTPADVSRGSTRTAAWRCPICGYSWEDTVNNMTSRGRACPACAGTVFVPGVNDLATRCPGIAEEWNQERNGGMTPRMVPYGSDREAWWKCRKCGCSWQAKVSNRTSGSQGCPVCAGQKVVAGVNDLATLMPDIAAEWSTEDNAPVTPSMVSTGSGKKYVWKCRTCGHKWRSSVYNRKRAGCPECRKRKAAARRKEQLASKENYLSVVRPDLAQEWDDEGNGDLTPDMVLTGSDTRVMWKCKKCGYRWSTTVYERARAGHGCPACAGQRAIPGVNDLVTKRPDLAAEWDKEKNDLLGLDPHQLMPGSGKKAWWICQKCGHSWEAYIYNRQKSGCPACKRMNAPTKMKKKKEKVPD